MGAGGSSGTSQPAQNAGQLSASPASIDFGDVLLDGSGSTQMVAVTNSGTASLSVSQATVSGAGFSLSGLTLPLSLTVGQSSSFTVQFAPTADGSVTGSVSLVSNAPSSTTTVAVKGNGVHRNLTVSPTSIAFGNILVGTAASQSVSLTNSGTATLTISQATITGAGFSTSGLTLPLTLTRGQSSSFTVQFAPTATGSVTGSVSLVSNARNSPTTVALSGTGIQPQLSVTPSSISFGSVVVGTTNTQTVTLTNSGTVSLTISQETVTGAGFSVSGLTLPLTLAVGQRANFNVAFAPAAAGSVTGSVSLVSNALNSPTTIALSGTGVAATFQLTASPTSLSFGNVVVGTSSTQTVTLTNTGNSNVTISQVSVSGPGFSTTGLTPPVTLAAGQSTTLSVVFAPAAVGSASGTVTVVSTATNSPATITLSGSGVQATSCGGPQTYCSRADLATAQLPNPIPQVGPNSCAPGSYSSCGNLTGANTIVTDPDFGNRILRITDANTDPQAPNIDYVTSASGAGDRNKCGPPDANGIIVCALDADGNNGVDPVFAIDTHTFQASRLYGPHLGIHVSWFSYTNPYIAYVWPGNAPIVQKIDFSDGSGNLDRVNVPTVANGRVTTIVDFSASPNCLYPGFVPIAVSAGGMSLDEQSFNASYSDVGGQNTATWLVYWTLGQGCRQWKTDTAQITGDWGPTGTMSLGTGDEFNMHGGTGAKGSGSNRIMTLAPAQCLNGTSCFLEQHLWQVETLTVNHCGGPGGCAAHQAEGVAHYITPCTRAGFTGQQICIHLMSDPANTTVHLTPDNPAGYGSTGIDRHPSWNAVTSTETAVVTDASFANFTQSANGFDGPFPSAWYDEIMGYQPFLPQAVYRFAHTFNTNCGIGVSPAPPCRFNLQDTIGSGTPDGKYFLWSSSWGRTLGSEGGGTSCTEDSTATRGGTLCRGDVFIVELK